jgi:hypothetical protein
MAMLCGYGQDGLCKVDEEGRKARENKIKGRSTMLHHATPSLQFEKTYYAFFGKNA